MVDNLVPVFPAHKLGGFVDFLRFSRFFLFVIATVTEIQADTLALN